MTIPLRRLVGLLLVPPWLCVLGCSPGVDQSYGRSRTASINGTGALAKMLRDRGHEVRTAVRLTESLGSWADVVVRVSPFGGPPPRDETDWYDNWLDSVPERRVVYVVRDHESSAEYWERALEQLPSDATPRLRERVRKALEESHKESALYPTPSDSQELADAKNWFAVEPPYPARAFPTSKNSRKPLMRMPVTTLGGASPPPQVCAVLEGPWAKGILAPRARLPIRRWLKSDGAAILLSCGEKVLAMSWTRGNGSRALVLANGSFVLNGSLAAIPARRPLVERLVDWAGFAGDEHEGGHGTPVVKRVALVEGFQVAAEPTKEPSVFDLLQVEPFGKVAAQLLALGLASCLALAPRLGRPRPDVPSGAERPSAHPEALGALLERTGQAGLARSILDEYRRGRPTAPGRSLGRPHHRSDGAGPRPGQGDAPT